MNSGACYLVVKLAAAGDVLHTTALTRALRQACPQATIAWLTTGYAAPLLQHNPDLDEVLVLKSESAWSWLAALRCWRRRHCRASVLLAHRSARLYASARLCCLGPVFAFGHGAPDNPHQHRLQQLAPLLAAAGVAASAEALQPRLHLTASEQVNGEALWTSAGHRPRWVIAPGGGANPWSAMPNRLWPRERFLEFALRAHAAGVALRWIGGAADRDRIAWICHRLPAGAGANLAGLLPLRFSAGVIAASGLLVGNDSLPLAMAHALQRPALGLYGPTPAAAIHAPGQPFVQGLAGCGPCYDPRAGLRGTAYRCPRALCQEQISVDAVWQRARSFLRWEGARAG